MAAELDRQVAGPSWLGVCCKKPRREQLLEASSANSGTWIKTLAYGELRLWGWWPRSGSSQSLKRWQWSIDGWTNCLGLCTQLRAHSHHKSTPWRKLTHIDPLSPCDSSKSNLHMYVHVTQQNHWSIIHQSLPEQLGTRAIETDGLTMAPTCKKGHPVDGNGHSAMLVVEVVDVMGGTEGGGNSGGHSWAGKHQQCQREHQPEQKGRTGPHHRWRCHWPGYQ